VLFCVIYRARSIWSAKYISYQGTQRTMVSINCSHQEALSYAKLLTLLFCSYVIAIFINLLIVLYKMYKTINILFRYTFTIILESIQKLVSKHLSVGRPSCVFSCVSSNLLSFVVASFKYWNLHRCALAKSPAPRHTTT